MKNGFGPTGPNPYEIFRGNSIELNFKEMLYVNDPDFPDLVLIPCLPADFVQVSHRFKWKDLQ